MWYVYILSGNRYYVGMTSNLERRLKEHQSGKTFSTKRLGGDIKLVGYFVCQTKKEAIELELKIKKSKNTKRRILHTDFVVIRD